MENETSLAPLLFMLLNNSSDEKVAPFNEDHKYVSVFELALIETEISSFELGKTAIYKKM